MNNLGKYILQAAVITATSVAITESLIVVKDTIKMRKAAIKKYREDGATDKEIKEQSKTIWLESLKTAAKIRVESIKNDPGAEICAIWGCITYFIGGWQGFNTGFLKGFGHGANGIDALMDYFKDKFPDEMTSIIKKATADNADVLLAEYAHNNTIERIRWVAEACDLPVIKEVEA